MLLDENPSIELSDSDATNLVRLLCASVKKAVGERIVPATDNRKQYHNKAQKVCLTLIFNFLNPIPEFLIYLVLYWALMCDVLHIIFHVHFGK